MRTNGTDNPQQNYNNKSKTPQSSCWPWLAGWLDGVTRDRASTYKLDTLEDIVGLANGLRCPGAGERRQTVCVDVDQITVFL